ncbi:MAG: tRNA 2-thiocytidine(32) synthetase TtcA [Clostridiales bacterium]|nr:tRNA 2-thiocytidine(32) synthetase TtcA [Clostridiales bacterium]
MKLQRLLSYVRRAVDEYNMIEEGDKIAVGVSGGKDSLALLTALNNLAIFYPKHFSLCGVCVDLGFQGTDFSGIEAYCRGLEVPLYIKHTDIGNIVFNERKEKNPCSLCSKMRKGALHDAVKKLGFNKVALGHNRDDVIETFFMSLFYEGRIHTFSPVTYLSRKELTNIRPLVYVPECDVKGFVKLYNVPVLKNRCLADGNTKREDMKKFIKDNVAVYDNFEEKIMGAVKRADIDGW